MSRIDFSCLCIFIVFAHLSESRVVILRDYDDEPFVLHPTGRPANEGTDPKLATFSISTRYRPKKMRSSKKAILKYGRYIYHFDNFENLKELRSKIFELKKPLKDGPVSYDYADINDWKAIDSAKDGDLLILPGTPLHFCNGEDCVEDRKMFRKYDDNRDWKHKKNLVKYIKRFQIVDNRHHWTKEPKRTKYDSSENNHKKKKTSNKLKKKKRVDSSESEKKKKQIDSSESMDSEKLNSQSWKSDKEKKHSSDKTREIVKKPRKKYESVEDWSNSMENISKIKKKNKKKNYGSYETSFERKTIAVEEDYFMQGNKIFHSKNRKKKKKSDDDRRRRLEHFLPKRYHWQPEEIHDLGYFWFNGPKGLYPAPKPL